MVLEATGYLAMIEPSMDIIAQKENGGGVKT